MMVMDRSLVLGRLLFLFLLQISGMCAETYGQTISSRFEAGVQSSLLQFSTPSDVTATVPPLRSDYETIFGFGGYWDWNLTRDLAAEGKVDWYPRHLLPNYGQEGGRTSGSARSEDIYPPQETLEPFRRSATDDGSFQP